MGGVKDDDHMIPVGEMARPSAGGGKSGRGQGSRIWARRGLAGRDQAGAGRLPRLRRIVATPQSQARKACSDISPGLAEKPQTLLRYAGVHGVFMSEFRPTAHDCVSNVTRRV